MSAVPIKHKPASLLPWSIGDHHEIFGANPPSGPMARRRMVSGARKSADDKADAEHAVHAVNAYPKLVEALRATCFDPELIGLAECRRQAAALLREIGEST